MPYILEVFSLSQKLLVQVGAIYLLIRVSIIIGSKYAHIAFKTIPFYKISSNLEFIHALILVGVYFALQINNLALFTVLICIRFIGLGVLNNTRFTWLKHAEQLENKDNIYVLSNVFTQSSYVVSGLCLIFFENSLLFINIIILIDIITSLVGAFLFLRLGRIQTSQYDPAPKIIGRLKLSRSIKFLLAIECLFALSMGGTNTFIYKYGENYLSSYGGYGLVLILYAVFYLISGKFISSVKSNFFTKNTILFLALSLLLIYVSESKLMIIMGLSLFFLSSIGFSLSIEKKWFNWSPKRDSSQIFGLKILLASSLNAGCELTYTLVPQYEILARFIATLACAILYFYIVSKENDAGVHAKNEYKRV